MRGEATTKTPIPNCDSHWPYTYPTAYVDANASPPPIWALQPWEKLLSWIVIVWTFPVLLIFQLFKGLTKNIHTKVQAKSLCLTVRTLSSRAIYAWSRAYLSVYMNTIQLFYILNTQRLGMPSFMYVLKDCNNTVLYMNYILNAIVNVCNFLCEINVKKALLTYSLIFSAGFVWFESKSGTNCRLKIRRYAGIKGSGHLPWRDYRLLLEI